MLQIDQAHAAVERSRTKARLLYASSLAFVHARTRLALAHIYGVRWPRREIPHSRWPRREMPHSGPTPARRRPDIGPTSARHRHDVGPMSARRRTATGATSERRRRAGGPPSERRRRAGGPPAERRLVRRRTAIGIFTPLLSAISTCVECVGGMSDHNVKAIY